jgi:NADP-dependent 3-hydroxy acid dehydrogenase YdfG
MGREGRRVAAVRCAWGFAMSSIRKVAVVTGASQGIRAGLVRGFLDRGYRVVANSRSIEPTTS